MSKPAFDPSKPYEVIKPAFDPSKPYEVVGEETKQQGQTLKEKLFPIATMTEQGYAGAGHPVLGKLAAQLAAPIDVVSDAAKAADWIINKVTSLGGLTKGTEALKQSVVSKIPQTTVGNMIRPTVEMGLTPSTYLGGGGVRNIVKPLSEAQQMARMIKASEEIVSKIPKRGIDVGNMASSAKPKTIVEKLPLFGSRMQEADRSMLSEVTANKTTSYNEYAKLARESSPASPTGNPRNLTPDNFAGMKAKKALDQIVKKASNVGAKKQALITANKDNFIAAEDITAEFNKLLNNRMGAEVFKEAEGGVVKTIVRPIAGRAIRSPEEKNLIEQAYNQLQSLGEYPTVQKADDVKAALRQLYEAPKATQAKPMTTITEGIIKNVRNLIDERIGRVVGKTYHTLNRSYADLKDIQDQLGRRLGQVVDATSGETRHGASLMKSAIQSTADRGAKALFRRVQAITGHDLMQEAKYAEIAMKAAKDPRIYNLLEEVGGISDALGGKAGAIAKLGKTVVGAVRKTPLEETEAFYNKAQKAKPIGNMRKK